MTADTGKPDTAALIAFLNARLDEEQARAEAMEHFTVYEQPYYSCAGSRTEPYGDLEWGEEHCDCFLAERKAKRLREVAAMRAVVADYRASVRGFGEGLSVPERRLALAFAAIWSDHLDYQEDWAP
ncbi:MAG TPA: DUF6221 family protein [Candidatus Sulfotelmatobacter sp.]|nr:DUF6221 family protein [Candidatus Sulfotelmatobacter sp.]